jgi:hypothetical protein
MSQRCVFRGLVYPRTKDRCLHRQQKVLNLEHYLEALTKKPGAFAGSTPLEQWRAQGRWPTSFDRFWETLKQRRGRQPGTSAMIDVLLLGRQHGYARLQAVVEKALEMNCFDVEAVRLLLDADRNRKEPREAIEVGALRNRFAADTRTAAGTLLLAQADSKVVLSGRIGICRDLARQKIQFLIVF